MGQVEKHLARGAGICGIFILLCGLGDTIMGILWIVNSVLLSFWLQWLVGYGSGLWSGIPLIIAGSLGIATWPTRSQGLMVAFVVFCIFACILASVQAIISGVIYRSFSIAFTACLSSDVGICSDIKVKIMVTSILVWLILSSLGAILSFAGSIVGCMGACCGSRNSGAVVQQPSSTIVMTTTQTSNTPGYFPTEQNSQLAGYPNQQQQPDRPPQYVDKQ